MKLFYKLIFFLQGDFTVCSLLFVNVETNCHKYVTKGCVFFSCQLYLIDLLFQNDLSLQVELI